MEGEGLSCFTNTFYWYSLDQPSYPGEEAWVATDSHLAPLLAFLPEAWCACECLGCPLAAVILVSQMSSSCFCFLLKEYYLQINVWKLSRAFTYCSFGKIRKFVRVDPTL